jgi:hypothetical protein
MDGSTRELRLVQVDSPDVSSFIELDNQNLRADLISYGGFSAMIAGLIIAGLFFPRTLRYNQIQLKSDDTMLNTFSHSQGNLTGLNTELLFQIRNADSAYDSRGDITVKTPSFTVTRPIAVEMPLFGWATLYHTRNVNFSSITVSCFLVERLSGVDIRFVFVHERFAQLRLISSMIFAATLLLVRAVHFRRTQLQLATTFLIVATVLFDDPFLFGQYLDPSSLWVRLDAVFKTVYFSYLMFFGFFVINHLKGSRTQFEWVMKYFAVLFCAIKLLDDFWITPIPTEECGRRIRDRFLFHPIVFAAVITYCILFWAHACMAYVVLHASAEYAFTTYCWLAGAVMAALVAYGIVVVATDDLSVRFTIPVAGVNVLALIIERAHADAGTDGRDYIDPAAPVHETRLECDGGAPSDGVAQEQGFRYSDE